MLTGVIGVALEDRKRILMVLSVTTLASFLTGFNARLAVVGIPTIAREVGADVWSMVWIIQGFMLGSTVFQLVIGRVSDVYGRIRVFLAGVVVFTLGALMAGLSINPAMLIASRIVQGCGGAILMNLSVTILTDNVPPTRLATWLGVNQVAWRAGALLGLTLSGIIIDYLGWHWIFLVQVPIGILVLMLSRRRLREAYTPVESRKLDIGGFAAFTSFLALLLVGLTLSGYGYRELSLAFTASSLVLLAAFTLLELKQENPALDLRLFKIWQFTGGIIAQLLYAIGFGASLTLLAIYMQSVKGYSPSYTGVLLIPYELSFLVSGLLGGRVADIVGFAPATVAGLSFSAVALYMLSKASTLGSIIAGELVLGVGTGLFVAPNTSSIMTAVPPHRRGVASALRTVSFNVGFILSLNIAILAMTQFIPYSTASQLITRSEYVGEGSASTELLELESAIKYSFLVQAVVMAAAIPFSLSRIKLRRESSKVH